MSFEDDNEDDVSIDFSKIKNIFKKKKKEEIKDMKEEVKEVEEAIEEKEEKIEQVKEELEKEEKETENIDTKKEELEIKEKELDSEIEKTKEELEEGDDEDISIDFSKIKNVFKAKSESKEEESNESEDDEISFDFSKIKNIFKHKKEGTESKDDDDEISVDIKKSMEFFDKNKIKIIPAVLIIIAMFFAIYIRAMPAYLPVTDTWARDSTYNYMRNQIRGQIDQQYPTLPDANKNSLVEKEFQKVLKEQKEGIEQQIEGTSNYFKSRMQNEKGQTYLLAIDPWFWMRHANNIIENGHTGDILKDGKPWDTHMYAPLGRQVPSGTFHAYFEAYLFKFLNFFNKDLELIKVAFYIPLILSALAVIPAFFIGRRITGNFGGFIGAFLVAIHPAAITRTVAGFSDTDAYNLLFPLLITWLFIEAFEAKNLKKGLLFGVLAGIFTGLYSLSWSGWWYITDFILVASIGYIIYYAILHRDELKKGFSSFIKQENMKNNLIITGVFLISTAIFISIISGFENFMNIINGPFAFAKMKEVGIDKVWPNVFTTVAEQNAASLNSVINQIGTGSIILIFISLIGISLTMINRNSRKKSDLYFLLGSGIWYIIILSMKIQQLKLFLFLISIPIIFKLIMGIKEGSLKVDLKVALLLILWFLSTIYASTKGVRFTLLVVPAYAIAFAVAIGFAYNYFSRWISQGLKINKNIVKPVILLLLLLFLLAPYKSAVATAKNEIPSMNDAWYASLDKINQEAEPDAIINSWWDFGHWFKAIGDRAVTFDGTSQNSPMAHWIGNVLLTDDEEVAVGILRMLDCSSNNAFEELDKKINDVAKSVDILYEVIVLDEKEAKDILLGYDLSEEEANSVLKYTHCEPPENYFITSDDMIGKSGVWAHFGSWNFDKALIYNTLNKKEYKNDVEKSVSFLQERFNYTKEKAEDLYYEVQGIVSSDEANSWISPWPSYASGLSGCSKDGQILTCNQGIQVNLTNHDSWAATQQGIKHPNSIVYTNKEGIIVKEFEQNLLGFSMTIIKTGENSYSSILMQPQLAASMFTRLFFMEGHGLKHFGLFSSERSVTGNQIYVWKVDWEGKQENKLNYYIEEEKSREEVHARHILVNSSEEAEEIISLLDDGKDFAKLAKERSIGPSGPNGGDLGYFKRGSMVKEFEDVAFSLDEDEISEPIKTQFGYHIIQVLDKKISEPEVKEENIINELEDEEDKKEEVDSSTNESEDLGSNSSS